MLFKRKTFAVRAAAVVMALLCCSVSAGCRKSKSEDSDYSYYTSVITKTGDGCNAASNTESGAKGNGSQSTASGGGSKAETKGKTFTIVSSLLPEKESSDNYLFEKIFFKRVREVEKQYGCKIKIVTSLTPQAKNLAPMIQAGKQVANVIEVEMRWLPSLIAAGYVQPWNGVSGINVNDAKYTSSYTKVATIGNKNWGLQYMKPPEVRYCVIMNKNLLKASGINADDIYGMINNKTWNYDKLSEYAKATTNASKGIYGVGGNPEYFMEMIMGSNNAKIVTLDGNGRATPTYTSKNVVESLDFMNKLVNVDKVYMTNAAMSSKDTYFGGMPDYIDQFIKGKITFLFEDSWTLNQKIRPKVKNFEYGMITIPLGPSGTDYVSPGGHARVFCLTSTNKELDFTAKIFNALAESPEGYSGDKWWKDEVQLDYFQSGDSKSMDIYLKSLSNMNIDQGTGMDNVFDDFERKAMFEPIFWGSGKTPAAAIESIKGNYDSSINDLFNK